MMTAAGARAVAREPAGEGGAAGSSESGGSGDGQWTALGASVATMAVAVFAAIYSRRAVF